MLITNTDPSLSPYAAGACRWFRTPARVREMSVVVDYAKYETGEDIAHEETRHIEWVSSGDRAEVIRCRLDATRVVFVFESRSDLSSFQWRFWL